MSLLEDHGGYWDNDEHFVIPLLRELDVPTGDRGASRFYSDGAESYLRSRRKERVGLLALWRRALLSLPLVAIVAAATVSTPGFVPTLGTLALQLFGLIPGNEIVGQAAAGFVNWIAGALDARTSRSSRTPSSYDSLLTPLYTLGTWALEAILIALLANALLPGQIDRLWANPERGRGAAVHPAGRRLRGRHRGVRDGRRGVLHPADRRAAGGDLGGAVAGAVRAPDRGRALRGGGRRRRSRARAASCAERGWGRARWATSRGASGSSSRRRSSASSSSARC